MVPLEDAVPSASGRGIFRQGNHAPRTDPTLRREFWDVVSDAVNELDERYRTVFILRDAISFSQDWRLPSM